MPKFPEPPPAAMLAAIPLDEQTVATGTRVWRIYFQSGRYATTWDSFRDYGPADGRFDHHLQPPRKQERAILYGAWEGVTCFAEVFQETRTIDRFRDDPFLVAFELMRPVRLLDLSGPWPTRAGASMAINSGQRARARRWSVNIYDAYRKIDGLLYCSSMNSNKPAMALYERARSAMSAHPIFHRALADPTMVTVVNRAALIFNYVVI